MLPRMCVVHGVWMAVCCTKVDALRCRLFREQLEELRDGLKCVVCAWLCGHCVAGSARHHLHGWLRSHGCAWCCCPCGHDVVLLIRFHAYLMPVSNLEGPQVDFPAVIGWLAAGASPDLKRVLAALQCFPRQVGQVIELMKQGVREGMVASPHSLRSVPSQITALMKDPSALYAPFETASQAMKEAVRCPHA